MFKSIEENVFDSVLKAAFNEYVREQLDIEPSTEELSEKYPIPKKALRTAKKLSKKVKYGKSPALVYLKRACVIALVCICVFYSVVVTTANEVNIWEFTVEAFKALPEKVSVFFGQREVIKTKDSCYYDSLEELTEAEDLNGALLPIDLDSKYSFKSIEFTDFGDRKDVSIMIVCDDELVGQVTISPSYKGNFIQENLVNIGRFDVIQCQYDESYPFDEVYQFEFNYGENMYRVRAVTYDILLEITESLN